MPVSLSFSADTPADLEAILTLIGLSAEERNTLMVQLEELTQAVAEMEQSVTEAIVLIEDLSDNSAQQPEVDALRDRMRAAVAQLDAATTPDEPEPLP